MNNKIMNELESSASDEEKQHFVDEEEAKGYRVGRFDDGSYVSIKE